MHYRNLLIAAALFAGVAQAQAQAQTPSIAAPSLKQAMAAAKAAVKACKGSAVAVVVLDASGAPKLYYVPDGSLGNQANFGFRKANTALLLDAPSETVTDREAADPALKVKVEASQNYITWPGGLPIHQKGQLVGAFAVAGAASGDIDKGCAEKAIKEFGN